MPRARRDILIDNAPKNLGIVGIQSLLQMLSACDFLVIARIQTTHNHCQCARRNDGLMHTARDARSTDTDIQARFRQNFVLQGEQTVLDRATHTAQPQLKFIVQIQCRVEHVLRVVRAHTLN